MEKILIHTPGSVSEILVGAEWQSAARLIPAEDTVIVTDTTVFDIYGGMFPAVPVVKIDPGERSKSLKAIERLADQLLKTGLVRTGFILAVGGGVVCDMAGFLASVFMRGIRCGYVSTTLLSQVDASTGGKTGVNLGSVKNIIGTFRQPEFVICDPSMLKTLPEDEYLSGLAELIKTGLIGDPSIIDALEDKYEEIMNRDTELLPHLVAKAIRFKASVVSEDEKESGLRRILNFGHTYGHAIELVKSAKHGFAVAEGIKLAAHFSLEKGFIGKEEFSRVVNLLKRYNLLQGSMIPAGKMKELVAYDKKRTGTEIHFVFIEAIGRGLVKRLPVEEVTAFYSNLTAEK
ncbi:MAG: 3-dehydroquinate synthase [Bacteroidota bacterium]